MAVVPATLGHALYGSARQNLKQVTITNYTGLSREDLKVLLECHTAAGQPPRLRRDEIIRYRRRGLIGSDLRLTAKGAELLSLAAQMVHEVWQPLLPIVNVSPGVIPTAIVRQMQMGQREANTLLLIAAHPGMARDAIFIRGREPSFCGEHRRAVRTPQCLAHLIDKELVTVRTETIERVYLTPAGQQMAREIDRQIRGRSSDSV
jgi:hypothetical protein